ncbi:MAG: NrfD/PsrC family molybdoenzyme membrane anchor subunit [Rhodanobacter sp.]
MNVVAHEDSLPPVIAPQETPASVTHAVSAVVLDLPLGRRWLLSLSGALCLTGVLLVGIGWLLYRGVGIWGLNIPVAWAFAITDYVWWIAIGMGGTFVSAAMYVTRQPWRGAINRLAESMTVFAVAVSGIFPILHLGRPWFFYWLFPYPGKMNVWPQWRSALEWDFWAILAYLLVSILFLYVGMIPDLATLRDRAVSRARAVFYGLLALGWRGEAQHWKRMESVTLMLAGLSVPLVFSVHSMVALDFSEGLLPGWHSTIFPPFFIAGALFSGFAMVLVLALSMRRLFGLQAYLNDRHIVNVAKLMLAAGLWVDYSYVSEIFTAFYSMDKYEVAMELHRFFGPYAWVFWSTMVFNVLQIQLLWFERVRRNHVALFVIALGVLYGMWLERFMLIVTSLYQDFMPSSWGMFYPTLWDIAFLAGSVGLFLSLYLLFSRLMPMLSMHELRRLAQRRNEVAS